MIEQRESFSVFALIVLIVLGVVSLIGIFLTLRKSSLIRTVALVTLFISLISFGIVAWTGYLGRQIRNTEISASHALQRQGGENEEDE